MSQTLLIFAFIAFVTAATPGPTVLLALSNGSRLGWRGALPGLFGAVLSDFILVGAAALGLGALLAASEFWFSVVKWVGVAYLVWLGIALIRSKGSLSMPEGPADAKMPSAHTVFMRSFLVAVTNPKGYLFVSAFLPQFIDLTQAQWPQYVVLAIVFAAVDFVVMFGYVVAGAQALRVLRAKGVLWLERFCGGTLLVLAGSLAFYRRQA
ncbi:MAG: amino acid transporter [Methylibium sp. NZG]|nr:MAG: amino acid transporter [Methylibium sp. NZG]